LRESFLAGVFQRPYVLLAPVSRGIGNRIGCIRILPGLLMPQGAVCSHRSCQFRDNRRGGDKRRKGEQA
jgi:hypothetical protein